MKTNAIQTKYYFYFVAILVLLFWIFYAIYNRQKRLDQFIVYEENLNSFIQKEIDEKVTLLKISDRDYRIIYKEGKVEFSIQIIFYCNSSTPLSRELEFLETQEIYIKKEKSSNVIYTIYNDICIEIHIY